jgi:hypothetical protein
MDRQVKALVEAAQLAEDSIYWHLTEPKASLDEVGFEDSLRALRAALKPFVTARAGEATREG